MKRLLPRTLGGQLLALLLVALIAAEALVILVFTDDRTSAVRQADRSGLLEGMVSVMRILALSPEDTRSMLAQTSSTRRIRYWISRTPAVAGADAPGHALIRNFQLERRLDIPLPEAPRLIFIDAGGEPVRDRPAGPWRGMGPPPWTRERVDIRASIPFRNGTWLNAQTRVHAEPVERPWPAMAFTALMGAAILAIAGLMTRRVTEPLAALAARVEAFGRGGPSEAVPERGPSEVRRLTAAFNDMQERLARFVSDRTMMLAAIGHDLRTPITSLRLRTELLDDEEAKAKLQATLDGMQRMIEATLAFARDDAAREPARSVDLEALVQSLADDLRAMGKDVVFAGNGRLPYACRPTALRRAIGNLVDNAVEHGGGARIALADTADGPVITVDDDGPGIPPDRTEEVFKPFVRLESSRSRETGGVGLGLSIARSLVLSHGGTLTLANRPEGGLRAEIRLPAAAAAP